MKIFDTLTQELNEFIPLDDKTVKMYVCGPTVYDYPHLGHARCYITWDVVYRYLKFRGYDTFYVRNVTDVDDKIINKAKVAGVTPKDITDRFYKEFKDAMKNLNILDPDCEPKATENIQEMIDIIAILVEKGFAYESEGDVYYRVGKYRKYGRLSKQNIEDLEAGARVEASLKKEAMMDFALWKAVKDPAELSWESPWGKGRPGWHIECSAMARKYIGETVDIHAGGQDLTFPHHENERAQSEAAFGKDFVKYWMHNGFVIINQEKMSKSLGNYVTINDILETYDANTIRFFILTNHYRTPIEFNDESLRSAKSGIKRLKTTVEEINRVINKDKFEEAKKYVELIFNEITKTEGLPFSNTIELEELNKKFSSDFIAQVITKVRAFVSAMDDDFNTSIALSVLFDLSTCVNKEKNAESLDEATFYGAVLLKISEVLGFDFEKSNELNNELVPKLMDVIISVRSLARSQKNWEISDKIRDELAKANITLKDHKDETVWSIGE